MEQHPGIYRQILSVIQDHPGTGGTIRLAKLTLSLWNDDCCFAASECLSGLDSRNSLLALQALSHYASVGEDEELRQVGHEVHRLYPHLWEISRAGTKAKAEWRDTDAGER